MQLSGGSGLRRAPPCPWGPSVPHSERGLLASWPTSPPGQHGAVCIHPSQRRRPASGIPAAAPAASGLLCATGDIMRLGVPTCETGQGHITERVSRKALPSPGQSPCFCPSPAPTPPRPWGPTSCLSPRPSLVSAALSFQELALVAPPGEASPRSLRSFIS